MLLQYCKFRAWPYHLPLQVVNDLGCSATCLPMYLLWAKNDFHNYFDKVEGHAATMGAKRDKGLEEDDASIKLMSAEDFEASKGEK